MPNHIYSKLIVSGPSEEVKRFYEFAKMGENPIEANKFIPYPEKYKKLDKIAEDWEIANTVDGKIWGKYKEDVDFNSRPKDGYNQGGYEWCIENWGTKWGFYSFKETNFTPSEIIYEFQTAWSPALPVILQASVIFPTLKFRYQYEDEGWNYIGYTEFFNGKVIKKKDIESKVLKVMFKILDYEDTEEGEEKYEKDSERIEKEIDEWLDSDGKND